ncbi:MAG: HAMP domain-containing histidine kinase [Acidobacteriota bacterium]|nr:HAMP domain-containing histidine kinase [Acidobacteriota bacterium]
MVRKEYCLFGIGVVLAGAGVYLAVARPGAITPALAFLPGVYATALAGYLFLLRAREVAGRERTFWRLLATACALWIASDMFGILAWPDPLRSRMEFFCLTFTLLPKIALMSALVMQPEVSEGELRDPVVRYEAALVGLWWLYLYLMFLTPWRWVLPAPREFWPTFIALHRFQDATLVAWLGMLALSSRGRWRRTYMNLAAGAGLLAMAIGPMYRAWSAKSWFSAMIFEALVASAFLWLALAPFFAAGQSEEIPSRAAAPALGAGNVLASLTSFGIPVLAIWSRFLGSAPEPVRKFRLLVSFGTLAVGVLLVYLWQDVADSQGDKLIGTLETSVVERRRLQGHFAEAEKLVSLGHLAAGAAHEINNPVAAMLGYAELLRSDASASERVRELGRKIGEQARRIRNLVQNLLSLSEQSTMEAQTVDVAAILQSAAELRLMGGRHRNESLRIDVAERPLEVRGDPGRLLQVFYRLLLALSGDDHQKAVDICARRDSAAGRIVLEFTERAAEPVVTAVPEVYDAQQAQKGTGLSLSVCDAIIKEHEGSIVHENLTDGRRRLRIELPALANDPALVSTPVLTAGPAA